MGSPPPRSGGRRTIRSGRSTPPCRGKPWGPVRRRRGRCGGSSRPSGGSSAATSWRACSLRGCTGRKRSACSSTSARTGRWCWGTGIGGSPAPPPPGPLSRGARSAAECARTRERSSRSGSNRRPRRRSGRRSGGAGRRACADRESSTCARSCSGTASSIGRDGSPPAAPGGVVPRSAAKRSSWSPGRGAPRAATSSSASRT